MLPAAPGLHDFVRRLVNELSSEHAEGVCCNGSVVLEVACCWFAPKFVCFDRLL